MESGGVGAIDDQAAADVAAMQFAGGMTIAAVAEQWERDPVWVEGAVRRALLASIPRRDGGLKDPRAGERAARSNELADVREAQAEFYW